MSTAEVLRPRFVNVFGLSPAFDALRERLDHAGGEMTPELQDEFDRLMRETPDAIDQAIGWFKWHEASADALKATKAIVTAEADRIQERIDSEEAKGARILAAVGEALKAIGGRHKSARWTAWLQSPPPRTKVTDATKVPRAFVVPQPDKLDIAGLGKALKEIEAKREAGEEVEDIAGAHLETGEPSVRVK